MLVVLTITEINISGKPIFRFGADYFVYTRWSKSRWTVVKIGLYLN